MNRRSEWDEMVSANLQKGPKVVAAFLTGLIECDNNLPVEEALRDTIIVMGIKEFCDMTGVAPSNATNFVNGKRKLGLEALNSYLKPLGLKTVLVIKKAS